MKSDLSFLISALDFHGVNKDSVSGLVEQFEKVIKLDKERKKMIKDDRPALINSLLCKYLEVKEKLDSLVGGKADLFVKKTVTLNDEFSKFRESLKNHPLGEEKLKEVFPIFFEGLSC